MARARNIKPSFFTNEVLGTLDPMVGITFIGLWCLADKDGTMEDRPLRIKAELFPYRDGLDVNGYLTVLEREGFIVRYIVDGVRYLHVLNFEKHQHPHHTEKSKGFPKPSLIPRKEVLTPLSNRDTPSDLLIPDSLIPDSKSKAKKQDKPVNALQPEGVTPQTWNDWLSLRKAKKAVVTTTVINGAIAEAEKAGLSLEEFLKVWCTRGSQGLEASWLKPHELKNSRPDDTNKFAGAI